MNQSIKCFFGFHIWEQTRKTKVNPDGSKISIESATIEAMKLIQRARQGSTSYIYQCKNCTKIQTVTLPGIEPEEVS